MSMPKQPFSTTLHVKMPSDSRWRHGFNVDRGLKRSFELMASTLRLALLPTCDASHDSPSSSLSVTASGPSESSICVTRCHRAHGQAASRTADLLPRMSAHMFWHRWTVPERTLQQRGSSATYETQIGPASSYKLRVLTDLGNGQSQPSSEDSVRAPAGGPAGPNQKTSCCKGVPIIMRCTLPTIRPRRQSV
jgi:hypothetical protein